MTYRQFKEAKQFVHHLGLRSRSQWLQYCRSGEKPNDIPTYPEDSIYKSEWKGWGDWLSTGFIAGQNRRYRPFEEARKFVHVLRIENVADWSKYCKSGNKPDDIPSDPRRYEKSWKGLNQLN